jgi:uncharacterized protein (TIGR02145 family)
MLWAILFISITCILSILSGIMSTWLEAKLKNWKWPTVIFFILLTSVTLLYIDKSFFKSPFKRTNATKQETVIELNDSLYVTDEDDNKYAKFTFNNKIWLSTNLNISVNESYCYEMDDANCAKYGKLYTYNSAMKACEKLGPQWRLPTTTEMKELLLSNGGYAIITRTIFTKDDTIGNPLQAERQMRKGGTSKFDAVNGGTMNEVQNIFIQRSWFYINFAGVYWLSPDVGDDAIPYYYAVNGSQIRKSWPHVKTYFSCRCVMDLPVP